MNEQIVQDVVIEILQNTAYEPFLCLPMSAMFYAIMKDRHNIETRITTGNLSFKGNYIFKQDFKISEILYGTFKEWSGHAWVEHDNVIYDLSFFRTLYSDAFTKACKNELIELFGEGKGALIAPSIALEQMGFSYLPLDYPNDDLATGIIKGYGELLKKRQQP